MIVLALEVTGDFGIAGVVLVCVIASSLVDARDLRLFLRHLALPPARRDDPQRPGCRLDPHPDGRQADAPRRAHRAQQHELRGFREKFPLGSAKTVIAADEAGRYAGLVEVATVHSHELDTLGSAGLIEDLAYQRDDMLMPSMNAKEAARDFDRLETDSIAVVDTRDTRRIVGLLTEAHVLRRYSAELDRHRREALGEGSAFPTWRCAPGALAAPLPASWRNPAVARLPKLCLLSPPRVRRRRATVAQGGAQPLMSTALLAVQTLNGLQLGVMLFLIAAGLTLVFGVMDFINLAHGVQYMLGAYFAVAAYGLTRNFLLALILALVGALAFGLLLEAVIFRHLYARDHLDQVLATFGVILFLTEAVRMIYGSGSLALPMPQALSGAIPLMPGCSIRSIASS